MNRDTRKSHASLDGIASRTGRQVQDVTDRIGDAAVRVGNDLEKNLDAIEGQFGDLRDAILEKKAQYTKSTQQYVHQNPWAAVGMTAGVAFIAGVLVARKKKS